MEELRLGVADGVGPLGVGGENSSDGGIHEYTGWAIDSGAVAERVSVDVEWVRGIAGAGSYICVGGM